MYPNLKMRVLCIKWQLFPPLLFAPPAAMKAQGHSRDVSRTHLGPEAFPILEKEAKIKASLKKTKPQALFGICLYPGKARDQI